MGPLYEDVKSHSGFVCRGDVAVGLESVPYPRTFMAWLRLQVDFPGRIQDLARDVVADTTCVSLKSSKALRRVLEARGVSDNVLDTLAEAEMVWSVTYGAADERQRKAGERVFYRGADARHAKALPLRHAPAPHPAPRTGRLD